VKNECVRFGGHVDIEVSYKILRLDVLKKLFPLKVLVPCKKCSWFKIVIMIFWKGW
jgi:hypothetical protein